MHKPGKKLAEKNVKATELLTDQNERSIVVFVVFFLKKLKKIVFCPKHFIDLKFDIKSE
jgi:hypothetical protein